MKNKAGPSLNKVACMESASPANTLLTTGYPCQNDVAAMNGQPPRAKKDSEALEATQARTVQHDGKIVGFMMLWNDGEEQFMSFDEVQAHSPMKTVT